MKLKRPLVGAAVFFFGWHQSGEIAVAVTKVVIVLVVILILVLILIGIGLRLIVGTLAQTVAAAAFADIVETGIAGEAA